MRNSWRGSELRHTNAMVDPTKTPQEKAHNLRAMDTRKRRHLEPTWMKIRRQIESEMGINTLQNERPDSPTVPYHPDLFPSDGRSQAQALEDLGASNCNEALEILQHRGSLSVTNSTKTLSEAA